MIRLVHGLAVFVLFCFIAMSVEAGLREPLSEFNGNSYECKQISVESVHSRSITSIRIPNTQFDCATKFLCIIKLVALDVK